MAAGTAALCGLSRPRAQLAERAPCSAAAWRLSAAEAGAQTLCDHVAFRTFGIDGLGVASLGKVLTDAGYTNRTSSSSKKEAARAVIARH